MRVNVYVDGFNLYYGALKDRPYRWLDLREFATSLLQASDSINRIRYFTARVSALPNDPGAPDRQAAYLRAIATLPDLSIHLGRFLANEHDLPAADGSGLVRVVRTEEKGSDVNLATYLMLDAFRQDYEIALVISNDSDLTECVRLVRDELGMHVGVVLPVLNPNANGTPRRPSTSLIRAATFERRIVDSTKRRSQLAGSQFADQLSDSVGSFHKPIDW